MCLVMRRPYTSHILMAGLIAQRCSHLHPTHIQSIRNAAYIMRHRKVLLCTHAPCTSQYHLHVHFQIQIDHSTRGSL